MRPQVITKTGTGSSNFAIMDVHSEVFAVSIGVVASGTLNYDIQHTYDDVFNSAVTPTWFPHGTIVGKTASFDGGAAYTYPVRAIKILVNSGTGTATATVTQVG